MCARAQAQLQYTWLLQLVALMKDACARVRDERVAAIEVQLVQAQAGRADASPEQVQGTLDGVFEQLLLVLVDMKEDCLRVSIQAMKHFLTNKAYLLNGERKAFLVRFSQSLHLETLGAGVHVTALCPGYTWSEFHDANGTRELTKAIPSWMWLDAETVVEQGYQAVEANRPVRVTGGVNQLIAAICKVVPDGWVLGHVAKWSKRTRGR